MEGIDRENTDSINDEQFRAILSGLMSTEMGLSQQTVEELGSLQVDVIRGHLFKLGIVTKETKLDEEKKIEDWFGSKH